MLSKYKAEGEFCTALVLNVPAASLYVSWSGGGGTENKCLR